MVKVTLTRGTTYAAQVTQFHNATVQKLERAALVVSHRAAQQAKDEIRSEMAGAGLGTLGNAIGSTSDLAKGRGVYRQPGGSFSASGAVFIRSKSKRTIGAIEAYTQGATIRPVRGRWLWFPSEDIQRVAGKGKDKRRLEPHNWAALGMEAKLGPLVRIKAANGNPLLIVRNVGVSATGRSRSARALTKRGMARKGDVAREFIVAFIGIPNTTRAARLDVQAILKKAQASMIPMFEEEIRKVRGR